MSTFISQRKDILGKTYATHVTEKELISNRERHLKMLMQMALRPIKKIKPT